MNGGNNVIENKFLLYPYPVYHIIIKLLLAF